MQRKVERHNLQLRSTDRSIASLPPDAQAHILQLQADSDQLRQLIPEDPGEDVRLLSLLGLAITAYLDRELDCGTDPGQHHRIDLLRGFFQQVGEVAYFITTNTIQE